jgi:DNA-binding CsgD family transcriptional regulator
MVEAGRSADTIAKALGMDRESVLAYCHEIGLPEPAGGPGLLPRIEEIRRLVAEGKTFAAIAEMMGCTRSAMCGFCARRGIRSLNGKMNGITKRKADRGFDGRKLGNAHAGKAVRSRDMVFSSGPAPKPEGERNDVVVKVWPNTCIRGHLVIPEGATSLSIEVVKGKPFGELQVNECRWPLWPDDQTSGMACGELTELGLSYCPRCALAARDSRPLHELRPPPDYSARRKL